MTPIEDARRPLGSPGAWLVTAGASWIMTACPGYPPPLPELVTTGPSTGAEQTDGLMDDPTDASTSTASDGAGQSTTAPPAKCGDGRIDPGEDCEGGDPGEATCEALGYSAGTLACAGCTFDATGCGPSPGMIAIPEGPFPMGSLLEPDEQPIRWVQVDEFWIDEVEVTVADYTRCVDAGACVGMIAGGEFNYGYADRQDHPINGVDWLGASTYCAWVDGGAKRLPTEAEWEKAARGVDGRLYPWGDEPEPSCTHAVMDSSGDGCGTGSTWPVGGKELGASPYGVLDMAGNVQEWVADWYGDYDRSATENPTGPATGTHRILRGGDWKDSLPSSFRATLRWRNSPSRYIDATMGFRCARTPPTSPGDG